MYICLTKQNVRIKIISKENKINPNLEIIKLYACIFLYVA